ncbi:hypothetical protein HMPREF9372_3802 [Sporosarcina newyorkensis 2681]|uniref:Uncharacterized protein n=1 Tax=Sporosarcina newyorkensis 2681 TaxID=1027292 RepID=F9DYC1_9BACL|nr:hypothetical protein HMPREF9372_3802 [Sporosarcina newyorkensis 2681]
MKRPAGLLSFNANINVFSKLNDMFSTVAYPDILAGPIAVYKEMK